ncbi:N-acetylglucosamine-6-phosphate deacetylase [Arthrobacter rhizosphaerae]|uniref:N-acetylglucosamine-6-phosphate deacetylase n=1 Tax=Arthrobacter rhizosphaerae TaxID=2855490 RepID=UPI001FF5A249|nr:N-acetylglucosamine-6-phosphate deacetylase [Arthrobacter rhizosphaerae]
MPADSSLILEENDDGGLGLRGRLITGLPGGEVIDDATVVIAGDRIRWCGPTAELPTGVDVEITRVPLILPGLVDVHCHGGFGHTFSADHQAARQAAGQHAANGTTSLLASLVSAPSAVLLEQILVLRELVEEGILAGLHLEGPFITKSMCGAQDPSAIIDGDPALLKQWLDAGRGTVRSLTLAPETAQFTELVALCREYGVVPSLGHTDATAARTREALQETPPDGSRPWSATHLFNRMPPLEHRLPGPVAVLLQAAQQNSEQMVLELIADGVHLDPEIVRMVFALVGPRSIALITDSMAAAGMADGPYTLGSLEVTVREGIARLDPSGGDGVPGAIAGGTSRLLGNVRRCVEWGIPLTDAVTAASYTPARLIGLNQIGALLRGYRADLLVTNDELEVLQVYRAGSQIKGAQIKQEGNDRADTAV